MEILSVYDSAFKPYGRVVEGYPTEGLVKALATTPCTDGVVYLPRVEVLHNAPNAAKIGEGLYGGMPYELGYCNGHNTKSNAARIPCGKCGGYVGGKLLRLPGEVLQTGSRRIRKPQ